MMLIKRVFGIYRILLREDTSVEINMIPYLKVLEYCIRLIGSHCFFCEISVT
jgi:hypothetical protein